MSASQRRKGMVAERELCHLLSDELGFVVKRNVDQARKGGADCIEIPGYAIECKRQEKLNRNAWWKQALEQADKCGMEPLVFFRQSRQPWRALMVNGIHREQWKEVSWEEAMYTVREKLARLYAIHKKAA